VSSEPIGREYRVKIIDDHEGTFLSFIMTADSALDVCLYCIRRHPSPARVTHIQEL
jgi:hypothetical protein